MTVFGRKLEFALTKFVPGELITILNTHVVNKSTRGF